jgi:hypothetical protein
MLCSSPYDLVVRGDTDPEAACNSQSFRRVSHVIDRSNNDEFRPKRYESAWLPDKVNVCLHYGEIM